MRVLCLGIHGTLRAGGAGAGAGATGFSRRKEPVGFLERLTRKEVALRRGRLGIGVLVRVPAVPVPEDQPEAGEYAPF